MQWKLPKTLTHFVQRAGRAARSAKRTGLAVLLVERSAYSVALRGPTLSAPKRSRGRGKLKDASSSTTIPPTKLPKEYAHSHGVNRGSNSGQDEPPAGDEPFLDPATDDEGLLSFVQTCRCRRQISATVFESPCDRECHLSAHLGHEPDEPRTIASPPTVQCCDICVPALFDRCRPGVPPAQSKKPKLRKRGKPDLDALAILDQWRETVYMRDHARSQLDPTAILDDDTAVLLVSVGTLTTAQIRGILENSWVWWSRYGTELSDKLTGHPITYTPLKNTAAASSTGINIIEVFFGNRTTTTDNAPVAPSAPPITFTDNSSGDPSHYIAPVAAAAPAITFAENVTGDPSRCKTKQPRPKRPADVGDENATAKPTKRRRLAEPVRSVRIRAISKDVVAYIGHNACSSRRLCTTPRLLESSQHNRLTGMPLPASKAHRQGLLCTGLSPRTSSRCL